MSDHQNEHKHLETVREESMDDTHLNLEVAKLAMHENVNVECVITEDLLTTNEVSEYNLHEEELDNSKDNIGITLDTNLESMILINETIENQNASLDQSLNDNLLTTSEIDDDNEFALMNKECQNVPLHKSFSPVNEEENIFGQEIATQMNEDNNIDALNDDAKIYDNDLGNFSHLPNANIDPEKFERKDDYQEWNVNDETNKINDCYDKDPIKLQEDNIEALVNDNLEDTLPIAVQQVEAEDEESLENSKEIEEENINKKILLDKYKDEISRRCKLQERNLYLQNRISEFLADKKLDLNASLKNFESKADTEQRYLKYIAQLDKLRLQIKESNKENQAKLENLSTECTNKQQSISQLKEKCNTIKNQILNQVVGWGYNKDELEQDMHTDERKLTDLEVLRLENIKLNNKIKNKNNILKAKNEFVKGLYMIDYEQLKIENQTYNEKIEERNEEIENLKKRISSCVQKLSHLQLKVEFLEHENKKEKSTDCDSSLIPLLCVHG